MTKIIKPEEFHLDESNSFRDKIIGIIGYGNQGRSQALNLRDSGFKVIIGNIEDKYAQKAREDGFDVLRISDAVARSDIIFLLIPDEIQPEIFDREVKK